jgi:hypothetical protein
VVVEALNVQVKVNKLAEVSEEKSFDEIVDYNVRAATSFK